MEIVPYQSIYKEQCLAIFESNLPKFFATEERELFIDWLDHHTATDYFVVKENDVIVACGGIFFDDKTNEAGLSWGMVHAARHGQGIGSRFTEYRLEMIREKYPSAIIRIETSQHTESFYKRFGFVTVNVIKDGFGKGYDLYNMSCR